MTAEALKVLDAVSNWKEKFSYTTNHLDWGGTRYLQTGETLPPGGADELRKYDAVFLGAIGHPDVKPGILERGLLLELRFNSINTSTCARDVKLYLAWKLLWWVRNRRYRFRSRCVKTPKICIAVSAAS